MTTNKGVPSKPEPISIYVHWPYCKSLCPYCDFNSHIGSNIDHPLWLAAYEKEIAFFHDKINGRYIQSIFFGGGTPSLMQPQTIEGIINKLASIGIIDDNTEITMEANPTSYEEAKFKQFKAAGVGRISLGVQALNDQDLIALGRKHSAKEALQAVESASNIFQRFSFDLIYCRPEQNIQSWEDELHKALSFARDHISLYQLTIEKGTQFYSEFKRGKLILPDDDIAASMYDITMDILADCNIKRYEISNYATQGQECRHNLAYWHYDEYLGIGPGAHSRLHSEDQHHVTKCLKNDVSRHVTKDATKIEALMMHHAPDKWLKSVLDGTHAVQQRTTLSQHEVIEEILMMGLRLEQGVSVDKIERVTATNISDILNKKAIEQYSDNGYLEYTDEYLRLTSRGLAVHNYIVPRIIL